MSAAESNGNFSRIKVVGVGGAGNNALNRMIASGLQADFIAVNTDVQSLALSKANRCIQIGERLTKGLGTGADARLGELAAIESRDKIKNALIGADMVFIAAGMGGGTGTGASPIIAECAREVGALTLAVVTSPFKFEGRKRLKQAEEGLKKLSAVVDSFLTIANDRLFLVIDKRTPALEAFRIADDLLRQGVQGISDLIVKPALVNLDFADVKAVLSGGGRTLMGIGTGKGENRVVDAVRSAIQNPLFETSIHGAKGILVNVTGSSDITLPEINEAMAVVNDCADPEANIIFGADIDEALSDTVKVTIIATGFQQSQVSEGLSAVGRQDVSKQSAVKPSNHSGDDFNVPSFMRHKR
ncbi:MAG: hypothetical protein H6Q66_475 [Firmicutes bacterium]|nr:hypothetical protein [Bacillota bacterium]